MERLSEARITKCNGFVNFRGNKIDEGNALNVKSIFA